MVQDLILGGGQILNLPESGLGVRSASRSTLALLHSALSLERGLGVGALRSLLHAGHVLLHVLDRWLATLGEASVSVLGERSRLSLRGIEAWERHGVQA